MDYDELETLAEKITDPRVAAELFWSEGYPAPIHIAAELMAQGANVEALERKYLNR